MVQTMAAKLGAPVEIVPRVPSLAYRLCLAARGAVDFAARPRIRTTGISPPPISCSRKRARV